MHAHSPDSVLGRWLLALGSPNWPLFSSTGHVAPPIHFLLFPSTCLFALFFVFINYTRQIQKESVKLIMRGVPAEAPAPAPAEIMGKKPIKPVYFASCHFIRRSPSHRRLF